MAVATPGTVQKAPASSLSLRLPRSASHQNLRTWATYPALSLGSFPKAMFPWDICRAEAWSKRILGFRGIY